MLRADHSSRVILPLARAFVCMFVCVCVCVSLSVIRCNSSPLNLKEYIEKRSE